MKPIASIPRRHAQNPDPQGFDALRLQAVSAAQRASGGLWTDYNLHDPGVSLLEALCFALTEDLFAARHPAPQLLGLGPASGPAAWARFGLHTAHALLHCHPCTARDWQIWLLQQLPHARQLSMRPLRDGRGQANGLWRMTLQAEDDTAAQRQALRSAGLQAFGPCRNLGEDLDSAPHLLRPRWVELEVSLQLEGRRDLCELLAELLQRCDDCISARLPEGLPARGDVDPEAEGPLGRALSPGESRWLDQDGEFLFASDIALDVQGIEGIAAVDTLRLHLAPGEAADPLDEAAPPGAVRRRGRDWALRLRWPDDEAPLARWQLARESGPVQVPTQALLQMLSDRRRVPLRLEPVPATEPPAAPSPDPLPALPPLRHDYYAASAALPPLYGQALLDRARREPGLRAQWQGYLGLLEQGLNQVQAQREQLPRLYALDDPGTRSYWASLPGDAQLPGVERLYLQPREQLETAPWIDEDPLARRNRVLNYQLALHGELLDHAGLQGLPCYFSPRAWPTHLLRLKRQFARRILRLGQHRGLGADLGRPLLGHPDNTPPLQERLALRLGLAQAHSRCLSRAWLDRDLPAPQEGPPPGATTAARTPTRPNGPADGRPVLDPAARRRAADWPRLRSALPVLRERLPAPLLRAAVRPELLHWAPADGGQLWCGPDEDGRHWPLAVGMDLGTASDHALALHEAACAMQAAGEGLHLVEHLLLRPLAEHADADPDADTVAATPSPQVSLVWSGWTARGASPRFRRLAAQIVEREAPAHLRCRLVWLDAGRMQRFESAWEAWLGARRAWNAALARTTPDRATERAAVRDLDERSARLRALLAQEAP